MTPEQIEAQEELERLRVMSDDQFSEAMKDESMVIRMAVADLLPELTLVVGERAKRLEHDLAVTKAERELQETNPKLN